MKANLKNIILLVLIVGVFIVAVTMMHVAKEEDKFVYSELVELFDYDLVKEFTVDPNSNITVTAYIPDLDANGKIICDEFGIARISDKSKTKTYSYKFNYGTQIEEINELAARNKRGQIIEREVDGETITFRIYNNLEVYNYEPPTETPWYVTYLPFIITGVI